MSNTPNFPNQQADQGSTPAAGWYPDPERPGFQRQWTGTEWGEERQPVTPGGGQPAQPEKSRKWLVPVVGLVALLVGYAMGSGSGTESEQIGALEKELSAADEEIADLEGQIADAEAEAEAEVAEAVEAEPTEVEEPEEEPEPEPPSGAEIVPFTPAVKYSGAGLTFRIEGLTIYSRDDLAEEFPDVEGTLEDSTRSIVVATARLNNKTGGLISFHPNQGTLVIGNEQVDANLFVSDGDVGGEIRDGVEREGTIVWEFESGKEKVVKVGRAEFSAGPAFDDDFNDITSDVELSLKW